MSVNDDTMVTPIIEITTPTMAVTSGRPPHEEGAEGQHEHDQGHDHADGLAVDRGGLRIDRAAELDLHARVLGVRGGGREAVDGGRFDLSGGGGAVGDGRQGDLLVGGDRSGGEGIGDGDHLREPPQVLQRRLDARLAGGDRDIATLVGEDHLGGHPGRGGEFLLQHRDGLLGLGAGDGDRIGGLAAARARDDHGGDHHRHPGGHGRPAVPEAPAGQSVEVSGHGLSQELRCGGARTRDAIGSIYAKDSSFAVHGKFALWTMVLAWEHLRQRRRRHHCANAPRLGAAS